MKGYICKMKNAIQINKLEKYIKYIKRKNIYAILEI